MTHYCLCEKILDQNMFQGMTKMLALSYHEPSNTYESYSPKPVEIKM